MVHLRVADADRAMTFFGSLFAWEAERVVHERKVSHYTLNTAVTVRLLEDPAVAPVVPNYRVSDVGATIRAIDQAGGRIARSEAAADGGGWARGEDDQGLPLLVYRPDGYENHGGRRREPTGDVGLVFIRADVPRAGRFYGAVLGWGLRRDHPESYYFDAVPHVGIFDEGAAFGGDVVPSTTIYFAVDLLGPALAEVEELGGQAGTAARDMGPYFTAMCTDDQGTEFGLMALELE